MKKSDVPEVKKKPATYQEDRSIVIDKKAAMLDSLSSRRSQLQMIFLSQYFKIFLAVSFFWVVFPLIVFIAFEHDVVRFL